MGLSFVAAAFISYLCSKSKEIKISLPVIVILGILFLAMPVYGDGTYDAAKGIYKDISFNVSVGVCLDLDLIPALVDNGDTFNSSNITVPCATPEADLRPTDDGVRCTYGIGTAHIGRISHAMSGTAADREFNCVQQSWTNNAFTRPGMRAVCVLTDKLRYSSVFDYGGASICSFKVFLKNETANPYLQTFSGGSVFETFKIDSVVFNGDQFLFNFLDLGWSNNSDISDNTNHFMDLAFDADPAGLYVISGTFDNKQRFFTTETNTDNTLASVPCAADQSAYSVDPLFGFGFDTEGGSYDIACVNLSSNNTNYTYGAIKIVNNTDDVFTAFIARYVEGLINISNVRHLPEKPAPDMSVTIAWRTSSETNGTAFWRRKLVGNFTDGWTKFVTIHDTSVVFDHNLTINNTQILENFQYQYYVKSGTTIDNNSDIFYNFTVFGASLPSGRPRSDFENETGPVLGDGINNMANAVGIEPMLLWNGFAFMICVIFATFALIVTKNPLLGLIIFATNVALFSMFGWLPYYLFAIITLIVSAILAMIIKKTVI